VPFTVIEGEEIGSPIHTPIACNPSMLQDPCPWFSVSFTNDK